MVLQHMYVFQIAVVIIGLLVGISAASLPDPTKPGKPLAGIAAFALSVGALYGLLPVVVMGSNFHLVLLATIFFAALGFANAHPRTQPQSRERKVTASLPTTVAVNRS